MVVTIFLILFAVAVYIFVQWANQPNTRTVSVASTSSDSAPMDQTVDTPLYTFTLPANFRVETSTHPTIATTSQLTAYEKQGNGIQVGITTNSLPPEGLNAVADYLYRTKNTDLYQTRQDSPFSDARSFIRTDGTKEVSNFIVHAPLYVSITVSSNAANIDQIKEVEANISASWEWKEK